MKMKEKKELKNRAYLRMENKREGTIELLAAAKILLAHHRIMELDGVSDTLQPRIDALRAAIAKMEG